MEKDNTEKNTASSKPNVKKGKQEEYTKLDDVTHVLLRPDTFVGSTSIQVRELPIIKFEKNGDTITYYVEVEQVQYCAAMERVFLEPLSNAFDNATRSIEEGLDPGLIKVTVNEGWVTIYNEGRPITTMFDTKEKMHVPQLIFSEMRSGSNFDDEKDRKYAGRNGYGAKLTNIFSKEFHLTVQNAKEGVLYKQIFKNNMRDIGKPVLTKLKGEKNKSFTEISYRLDFGYFYAPNTKVAEREHRNGRPYGEDPTHCKECWMESDNKSLQDYDSAMVALMARHALDAAFNSNVKIYFNEVLFNIKNPVEYARAYINIDAVETPPIIIEDANTRLVLLDTPHNGFIHSFANGMCTIRGGIHVNSWLNAFSEALKKDLKKKGYNIRVDDIKRHVTMFLSVIVDKPKFDTQTKECLEAPKPNVTVTDDHIRRFNKWKAVEELTRAAREREMKKVARQTDGKKLSHISGIPKLDDAGWAGDKRSLDAILYVCEGDSAKTFWTTGLRWQQGGRDKYGCLPLRGKILNTKKADHQKFLDNKVISDLKKVLGLREDLDYTNEKARNTLRYGKLRILTDADDDGIHIRCLIVNLISGYAGLLETGYIDVLLTPVVIVDGLRFLNYDEYRVWSLTNKPKGKIKYYKGLGTARPEDIKESFMDMVIQNYVKYDQDDKDALQLAFGKMETEKRKQLYRALKGIRRKNPRDINCIEDLICDELITFAETCNRRAIPSFMDGLKNVQRKIVFATRKSGKMSFVKVSRFAGTVAENTDYKHGPESMQNAIINMAQDFPGSNNMPLLEGSGGFGSRSENGRDASAARYIDVRPHPILPYIIRDEDDVILSHMDDDGELVEPHMYYPIIPLSLCNGSNGVGWGWSSDIPSYNPLDLIDWIRNFIEYFKQNGNIEWKVKRLDPWYKDYHGTIERDAKGVVRNTGIFEDRTHKCIIKEIPIGTSDLGYREKLENMVENGIITGWKPLHVDPNQPSYVLVGYTTKLTLKTLGLDKIISETNLVFLDEHDVPQKYEDVQSIMLDWCEIRYKKYEERKNKYLVQLKERLRIEQLRYAFVKEVSIDKTLKVINRDENELKTDMDKRGYPWIFMSMKIQSLTAQKLIQLQVQLDQLTKDVTLYENTPPEDLWLNELIELEEQLRPFIEKTKSETVVHNINSFIDRPKFIRRGGKPRDTEAKRHLENPKYIEAVAQGITTNKHISKMLNANNDESLDQQGDEE